MAETTGDTRSTRRLAPPGGVAVAGARTPEELETLFEDAVVVRDSVALGELFEAGAVIVTGDHPPARGAEEIRQLATALWADNRTYVANPLRILLARDIALIVAEQSINVVRRGSDGAWRYAIALLFPGDKTAHQEA